VIPEGLRGNNEEFSANRRDGKMFKILTDEEVVRIHDAALQVMDGVGVAVRHGEVLKALEQVGVEVDWDKTLARFPSHVVEEFVRKAPPHFIQGGRVKKHDFMVENGKVHARSVSGCDYIMDMETGKRRVATKKDAADGARIMDALENLKYVGGWTYPSDEFPSTRDICLTQIMLENTEKHIAIQAYEDSHLRYMTEMAALVAGGQEALKRRPLLSIVLAPTSPLILSGVMVDQIVSCGKYRLPAIMCSTPISGATAPITLAGQFVILHAENLTATVIAQVLSPGTPVVYGARGNSMDMRTGNALWGSVEYAISSAAAVQMGHHCGLPVDTFGIGSDSKTLDEQAAVEKSFMMMFPALAGVNLLAGAGYLESIKTASFEEMVIDNEMLGIMYRALRGIRVEDETLAVDLISRLGPGASYLAEKHTRKHLMNEHYLTRIFDRNVRERWEQLGAMDSVQKARQEARRILKEHIVPPLDKDLHRGLTSILDMARKELSKDHGGQ
jgi:trimethylamine--corrinoid protein Co-methyltransferase